MSGLRNLGLVTLIVMAPAFATAATPAPSAAVRAACAPDAKRLCAAVIGNPEARHKCMVEHRAQLSETCKTAIADDKKASGAPATPPAAADPSKTSAPSGTPAASPSDTK